MNALQTADAPPDDAGLPVELEPALPAGTMLGSWRVLRTLGEGGMGRVYLAEHAVIGRRAAIKVLKRALSANVMSVERFFDEARAVNSVRHDGIVDVTDLFIVDGQPCIVMELLAGETLAALLILGPLSTATTVEIGIAVAEALDAAHKAGIVHRDLKADNIMVVSSSPLRLKVLDFGVAKLGTTMRERGLTAVGAIVGTPEFMAPEQLAGTAVDHRADIYALGIALFQMLTATLPFSGQSFGDWVVQHMTVPPPDVRERAPQVPPALASLIAAMLQKDREARPASMAAVVDALRAIDTAASAPGTTTVVATPAFPWRLTAAVAAAVIVVAGAITSFALRPTDAASAPGTLVSATPTPTPTPTAPVPAPPAAAATPSTTTTTTPTATATTTIVEAPAPSATKPVQETKQTKPETKQTKPRPRPQTTPTQPARSTSRSAVVDPFAEDS